MSSQIIDRRLMLAGLGVAGVGALAKLAEAGSLSPPLGPVAPTGRSLQEVFDKIARTDAGLGEPRIPVQSLGASGGALYAITQPGSYYLTDEIVGVAGKGGIEIAAPNVTLDLAGFAVLGVPGSLDGIRSTSAATFSVAVCRGSVANWGANGIDLTQTQNAWVHEIRATQNQGTAAIFLGVGAIASSCVMHSNGQRGIKAQSRALVLNCESSQNASHGFYLVGNSQIIDSSATFCGIGIWLEFGGQVERCVAYGNSTGIQLSFDGTASRCDLRFNSVGIVLLVSGNALNELTVTGNSGTGILVQGSGNFIARNRLTGNGTNTSISPGNSFGPIVNVAGVGDITTVPGADHPWANFVY